VFKHNAHHLRKALTLRNLARFIRSAHNEGLKKAFQKSFDEIQEKSKLSNLTDRINVDASLETDFRPFALPTCTEKPKVSIIIPVYNQWQHTYTCLKSLTQGCKRFPFEVILADDGSTDQTKDADKIVSGITIVKDGVNRGFLRNCNNAARLATGCYLYFLNNDTKCLANAIDHLIEVLETTPSAGIAGSKLLYPNGLLQEAGGIIWADGSAWNYGRGTNPDFPDYQYIREVDYVSGASLMIRRPLWEKLNGFDDRYAPAYCEDSDLAFSVRQHGFSVLYNPRSEIIHFEGITNGKELNSGIKKYQIENTIKFMEKWHSTLIFEQLRDASGLPLAKDRRQGAISVLIVDHFVPQFDKDAGSRTVKAFIDALLSLGCQVKFIGDNFFPHQPYTDVLQRAGVEILYGTWFNENWQNWIKSYGNIFDVVLLNRPHIAPKYLPVLRKHSQAKILYYGHDLHYLREERRLAIPGQLRGPKTPAMLRTEELSLMQEMDAVLSCSIAETQILSGLLPSRPVHYFPAYAFDFQSIPVYSAANRNGLIFVGGFTHDPNVDGILWFIREVWPLLVESLPEVHLTIIGSNVPESISRFDGTRIRIAGYVDDGEMRRIYHSGRIAIVPLRYGAGVKGKTVEALALGLPIVSTPIGVEGLPPSMEVTVGVAEPEPHAFATLIKGLYTDSERLERMSRDGMATAREHFSPSAMASAWRSLISSLALRPRSWARHAYRGPGIQVNGKAMQAGPILGYHADRWVGPCCHLPITLSKDARQLTIIGWAPDWIPPNAQIAVSSTRTTLLQQSMVPGELRMIVPIRPASDGEVDNVVLISIHASWWQRPVDHQRSEDTRPLSWMAKELVFE